MSSGGSGMKTSTGEGRAERGSTVGAMSKLVVDCVHDGCTNPESMVGVSSPPAKSEKPMYVVGYVLRSPISNAYGSKTHFAYRMTSGAAPQVNVNSAVSVTSAVMFEKP